MPPHSKTLARFLHRAPAFQGRLKNWSRRVRSCSLQKALVALKFDSWNTFVIKMQQHSEGQNAHNFSSKFLNLRLDNDLISGIITFVNLPQRHCFPSCFLVVERLVQGWLLLLKNELPSKDILALLEFKKGIEHDPTGMRNPLNLMDVLLRGMANLRKIPDKIVDLKSLEILDLSNNLFSSYLPFGIGALTGLRNLPMAGNDFSGQIPDSISGMASMQALGLSCNSFSGALPPSLTKLTSLMLLN
ncbi:hypothetical protein PIB30_055641 [Stylosanthes scabra]|uniref:Uncharacterized protein n=1 Tax=Stylosanthes scabra TaxID=79078 RepID=A0ABU6TLA6_9FABA|nr:hypothetical protein [Stylosanthes scabra]